MSDRPKALAPVNRKLPVYEPAQRGASLCLHRWKVHRIGGKKVRICSLCDLYQAAGGVGLGIFNNSALDAQGETQ